MATNGQKEASTGEASDTVLKTRNDEYDGFGLLPLSLTDAIQHDIHVDLQDIHPVPPDLVERARLLTEGVVVDLAACVHTPALPIHS